MSFQSSTILPLEMRAASISWSTSDVRCDSCRSITDSGCAWRPAVSSSRAQDLEAGPQRRERVAELVAQHARNRSLSRLGFSSSAAIGLRPQELLLALGRRELLLRQVARDLHVTVQRAVGQRREHQPLTKRSG